MVNRNAATDFFLLLKRKITGFNARDVRQQMMITIVNPTDGSIEPEFSNRNLNIAIYRKLWDRNIYFRGNDYKNQDAPN